MTIPRSRGDAGFEFAGIVFVVFTVVIAIAAPAISLWLGGPYPWLGLVASLLWLFLVAFFTLQSCKDAGGLRRYALDIVAGVCGRLFAEINTTPPEALELGVYLLGRRFVQQTIPLDSIESVEWNTGQATSMAGHDMNDWHVWIWFAHNDPAESQKRRKRGWQKAEQSLYGVGPSGPKAETEALGLSLVAFLRAAGADLLDGPTPNGFVRRQAAES